MLCMPIEWLCDGQVVDAELNPTSSCGDGFTCVAGECQTLHHRVPATALPNSSTSAAVFGGASTPGTGGTCLDTVACFAQGYGAKPDDACSLPVPTGGMGINVALVTAPGGSGICGPDACLIPLDNGPEGWEVDNGRVQATPRGVRPPEDRARCARSR